jgi:chloramphenicol O-acetyltransferase type B
VGSDVWIGRGVKIKAGVTIGHGAVLRMGSVVVKDVAPYTIVGGNPAREIRKRFEDRLKAGLLKSAWWDATEEELHRIGYLFNYPAKFLASKD